MSRRTLKFTPQGRSEGIFAFAAARNCGVLINLINKPLAQGLLTGSYDPAAPRVFGEGDHRCRKRWFTPGALTILTTGLDELRGQIGPTTEHAAVLVGFTSPDQIKMNLTCFRLPPTEEELAVAREIMARAMTRLRVLTWNGLLGDLPAPSATLCTRSAGPE